MYVFVYTPVIHLVSGEYILPKGLTKQICLLQTFKKESTESANL